MILKFDPLKVCIGASAAVAYAMVVQFLCNQRTRNNYCRTKIDDINATYDELRKNSFVRKGRLLHWRECQLRYQYRWLNDEWMFRTTDSPPVNFEGLLYCVDALTFVSDKK